MNPDEFEAGQRAREWFHGLKVPPGMWAVVRVDGRSFTKLTENLEKPFAERFSNVMAGVAQQLLIDLGGVYAYTESDEISVVLAPSWDMFARSVEKTVSVSAGIASATFTALVIGHFSIGHFDSRLWIGASAQDVVDYMSWRQADAARCCLNGWVYWTLRQQDGMSARAATRAMDGMAKAEKHDLLMGHGINFNDLPLWQRRGIGLWWEEYMKEGHNPLDDCITLAPRRRVNVARELPMSDDYRTLVAVTLEDWGTGPK